MIRMVFETTNAALIADGEPPGKIMFLGLSRRNIELLQQGKPISFDGTPLGFLGTVIISFGETEQGILDAVRKAWNLQIPDVPPGVYVHPHIHGAPE